MATPTSASTAGFLFKMSAGASPEVYTAISEVFSISGLGAANELIDVTNFDSAGAREFIGGLADGQEVTIEANYIGQDTQQDLFTAVVVAKSNRSFQILHTGSSPNAVFTFTGTPISWEITPSVDDKNVITWVVKISGAIVET